MSIRSFSFDVLGERLFVLHTPLTRDPVVHNRGWVTSIQFLNEVNLTDGWGLHVHRRTTPVNADGAVRRRLEREFIRDDYVRVYADDRLETQCNIWFRLTRGRQSHNKPRADKPSTSEKCPYDLNALYTMCKGTLKHQAGEAFVDWIVEYMPEVGRLVTECGELPTGQEFRAQCAWVAAMNREWNKNTDYSTHEV